ncbi:MAG TPA: hypothetical protein VI456_11225 [Polyangia bacterium]
MNVRPTSPWPAALSALTLSLALGACGRVPGQFEILNDQIPIPAGGGGCTIPVEPSVYQGEGTLDVSIVPGDFTSAYFFFPLIENNLPASTGQTSIDPNEIQLSGFQVDITLLAPTTAMPAVAVQATLDMNASFAHYQVPWSGGVGSGGGHLSAGVAAFPVPLAQALAQSGGIGMDPSLTFDLTIAALGTTNSGSHMTSDPFHFPLHLCSGCLVANKMPCPFPAAPTNPGNPCNPAQDVPVDCCTENGALVCPPTVAAQ